MTVSRDRGGGIFNAGSSLLLTHTLVFANTASVNGGGLYDLTESAVLNKSVIFANTSDNCAPVTPLGCL